MLPRVETLFTFPTVSESSCLVITVASLASSNASFAVDTAAFASAPAVVAAAKSEAETDVLPRTRRPDAPILAHLTYSYEENLLRSFSPVYTSSAPDSLVFISSKSASIKP